MLQAETIQSLKEQVNSEPYASKLGIRLKELESGRAVVEMIPGSDCANIFGMVHGGAIFSLIDEAFQASCNSHGTVAVALTVSVNYHRSCEMGTRLCAESKEIACSHKTATYEIMVTDDNGTLIASCLALAYRKRKALPFVRATRDD